MTNRKCAKSGFNRYYLSRLLPEEAKIWLCKPEIFLKKMSEIKV